MQALCLLSEFLPFHDMHDLLYLELPDNLPSVDSVLTALGDGSLSPDSSDDPSWADAMASPEHEYWIAGGRDELKSLKDLKSSP